MKLKRISNLMKKIFSPQGEDIKVISQSGNKIKALMCLCSADVFYCVLVSWAILLQILILYVRQYHGMSRIHMWFYSGHMKKVVKFLLLFWFHGVLYQLDYILFWMTQNCFKLKRTLLNPATQKTKATSLQAWLVQDSNKVTRILFLFSLVKVLWWLSFSACVWWQDGGNSPKSRGQIFLNIPIKFLGFTEPAWKIWSLLITGVHAHWLRLGLSVLT
jgi:hypothetical protein